MESGLGPPQEWIGREVRVVLQGEPRVVAPHGGPVYESIPGILANATELGVTLEEAPPEGFEETAGTLSFIPWTAIRGIRL